MTDHPITPPPELVQQWVQATESNDCIGAFPTNFEKRICTSAARWGSDQELEECCAWVEKTLTPSEWITGLRAARRPNPPSLKDEALKALGSIERGQDRPEDTETIRRALEQLDD